MAKSPSDRRVDARLLAILGGRAFAFLICAAAAFLITFARNPDPYFERVLVTEDGNPYYNMLQIEGFWPAVFRARGDYFVFGNLALAWAAVRACDWFSGGDPFVLPAYIAVASYLFFGAVAALPVLLLRRRVPLGWLAVLAILMAFLPLAKQDNEILGRISNTGFSWLTIAFLAAIRRDDLVRQPARTRRERAEMAALDMALLASVATNPNALLLLPLVFLPYARRGGTAGFLGTLRRPGLAGAIAVALGSLPTAFRVVFRDRAIPGPNATAPFTLDVAAELVGARALLYPVAHAFYGRLTPTLVFLLLAAMLGLFLAFGRRRNLRIYALGAFVLASSGLALAALRPELYRCCRDFRDTYPLRYVRAQNEIVLCLLVLLAWDMASNAKLPKPIRLAPLLLAACFFADAGGQSSFKLPGYRFDDLGDLGEQVVTAIADRQFCDRGAQLDPNGAWLRIRTYPIVRSQPGSTVLIPRTVAEDAVLKRADREDFAPALEVIRQGRAGLHPVLARTPRSGRFGR